jgi:hypothetical protein
MVPNMVGKPCINQAKMYKTTNADAMNFIESLKFQTKVEKKKKQWEC